DCLRALTGCQVPPTVAEGADAKASAPSAFLCRSAGGVVLTATSAAGAAGQGAMSLLALGRRLDIRITELRCGFLRLRTSDDFLVLVVLVTEVVVISAAALDLLRWQHLLPAAHPHPRQHTGIFAQGPHECVDLEVGDDEERQSDEDDRRLKCFESTGSGEDQQGGGDDRDGQCPEDPLRQRVEVLVSVVHRI